MTFADFVPSFRKYWVNQRIISYGIKETKFIGGPPGEPLKIIDFKKLDKGCELWFEGHKYPMRTHSSQPKVTAMAQAKRLIPLLTKSFKRKLFFVLNLECVLDWLHYYLYDCYLQENEYCQPVRELYRVIKNEKVRDIICAILEYDTSYRLRVQDIAEFIDKSRGAVWNINHILDILIAREVNQGMRDKWIRLKSLTWVLHLHRGLVRDINQIIKDINVEEVKMSVEDKYWSCAHQDYNFLGLTSEERKILKPTL